MKVLASGKETEGANWQNAYDILKEEARRFISYIYLIH